MITIVVVEKSVTKGLRKLPQHVVEKLLEWIEGVEKYGLERVRQTPGFHDEPLMGKRIGQRSIRLSRGYRALYKIEKDTVRVEYVRVFDVNKHDY